MHLVVGLGNPGRRYAGTRHNIGFQVIERLGERWAVDPGARTQFNALVGDGIIAGERCILARPQGFMNRSGHPVVSLAGFYKLPPEKVVAIHDDLDLPFADIRCKAGGGPGGHNGLRDIHQHLGRDHLRVRFGIGRPPEGWDSADFVLARWTDVEQAALPPLIETACDAVEMILREGIEAAMNRFNVRANPGSGRPAEQRLNEAR